jgi:hypothetical protein
VGCVAAPESRPQVIGEHGVLETAAALFWIALFRLVRDLTRRDAPRR